MMRQHDQGHHRQHANRFGAEDAVGPVGAERQVTRRVERAEEEEHAQEAEDELAQRIEQAASLPAPDAEPLSRRKITSHDQDQVRQRTRGQ